jgi:hypothetical protein
MAREFVDRLYFYGDKRPLHVSSGPENKSEIVVMTASKTGRLVPRVVTMKAFLALSRETTAFLANGRGKQ